MINKLILICVICLMKILGNTTYGQNKVTCSNEIQIAKNTRIEHYEELPNLFDTVAVKGDHTLLLTQNITYTKHLFLATFKNSEWRVWEINDYVGEFFSGELQILKIQGIKEWLVYVKWSHKDGGSGLGSFNQGKMLWAKNGMTCYLNTIDRSNYYEKIYEGKVPNQKYSRRFKEYYCRMQISKEGIIVRHNNTCKNKFKGIEGVEQISHDQVGKYAVGIYTYQNGKWVRDK